MLAATFVAGGLLVVGQPLVVALFLGVIGMIYVLGRAGGKLVGATLAARRLAAAPAVQRFVGYAMLSQAGLAIGLLLTINRRFPELAPVVTTVVLAAVTVFELVGPLGARHALVRAGETRPQPPVTGLLD